MLSRAKSYSLYISSALSISRSCGTRDRATLSANTCVNVPNVRLSPDSSGLRYPRYRAIVFSLGGLIWAKKLLKRDAQMWSLIVKVTWISALVSFASWLKRVQMQPSLSSATAV